LTIVQAGRVAGQIARVIVREPGPTNGRANSMNLKANIIQWLSKRADTVGFAPVERFEGAPEKHRPSRVLQNARTVIVFGKAVPRGMLRSPDYSLHIMHRAYHTMYPYLDELALELSLWIEGQGDYLSVPIPSYAPMVFQGREPWGILSLKHAAVCAGLGSFGKNELVHNAHYGTLLRFGAVVTSAELPGDSISHGSPCPDECAACFKACPSKAFTENGSFQKMNCLAHTIKHAIYPLAFRTPEDFKYMERVINTAGYNYWLTCNNCMRVCPSNRNVETMDKQSEFRH